MGDLGIYFESIYLMTASISTVGYGDYKGFIDDSGDWVIEMSVLIFVMILGICCFGLVTN